MIEGDRMLTREEVENLTGFSRATIYRLMKQCVFPRPFAMGARASRWPLSEVQAYIATRQRIVRPEPDNLAKAKARKRQAA